MSNAWIGMLLGGAAVLGGAIADVAASPQAAKTALPPASARKANPTFVTDIAPILAKHCMTCHRPGEVAPMSLLTYEATRPWAKSVREAVVSGAMPPWHADPQYGQFENENRLKESEIALITQWVNNGAPRGEGTFTPPSFAPGWQIPPDLVFEMAEEYVVPAAGPDINIELEVPMNLTEDIWVISAETRGDPRVVHHNVVSVIGPDGQRDSTGRLASYTPGKLYDKYGEDAGKFIRRGSKLLFSMHYHPNGTVIKDRSKIGLKLARKPLKYQVHTKVIADPALAIPPNHPNYRSVGEWVFDVDAEITLFKPHMHWRGKDMLFKAIYADGKEEILLSVPKFDMNWQMTYEYAIPKMMPKGTKLIVIAHFDNSSGNPWNPDPAVKVLWGMDSRDEMMEGWFDYRVKLQSTTTSAQGGK